MFVSVRKGAIKGRQEQQQQQHPKRNRIERKYAELMRSIQGKVSQIKHSQTHTPLITDFLLHIIERRNAANKYWRPRQGKKIKFTSIPLRRRRRYKHWREKTFFHLKKLSKHCEIHRRETENQHLDEEQLKEQRTKHHLMTRAVKSKNIYNDL